MLWISSKIEKPRVTPMQINAIKGIIYILCSAVRQYVPVRQGAFKFVLIRSIADTCASVFRSKHSFSRQQ
jgi:hypothetical protein